MARWCLRLDRSLSDDNSLIAGEKSSHYVWTNADGDNSNYGHKLSDEQYNALLREIEIIGGKFID